MGEEIGGMESELSRGASGEESQLGPLGDGRDLNQIVLDVFSNEEFVLSFEQELERFLRSHRILFTGKEITDWFLKLVKTTLEEK